MFDRLDFVYLPSDDVAADIERYTDGLGAELVFAIERFGTRVAMVRADPHGPALLLAEHLEGEQPILIFRVTDLEAASAELRERGVELGGRVRDAVRPRRSGGVARPAARGDLRAGLGRLHGDSLAGRRDF